jgi:DNA/RNA endonuclease YhcR with UshA esterase domain
MLSEKKIIKYSLIASVIGLAGIYLLTQVLQAPNFSISDLNDSMTGKVIQTQGTIKSIQISNTSTAFIALREGESEIEVVLFNAKQSELKEGEQVSITGEVNLYKGKLEIMAKEVRKI